MFNRALGTLAPRHSGAATAAAAALSTPAVAAVPSLQGDRTVEARGVAFLGGNTLDGAVCPPEGGSPLGYLELDAQAVGPAPDAALEEAGPDSIPMTSNSTIPSALSPSAAPSDVQPPDGAALNPCIVLYVRIACMCM
jgi:hypothetical protein